MLCSFPYLVVQPSRGVVCDPFGTGRSPSELFKGEVVSLLFIQCCLAAVAGQILREIVASDESGRVKNGPANHNSDSRHCI